MYNHIMLEVHCAKGWEEKHDNEKEFSCLNLSCVPTYDCLVNKCPFATFTTYENALCYVNKNSICEKSVAWVEEDFENNESLRQLWQNIAIQKIEEAKIEFLERCKERD